MLIIKPQLHRVLVFGGGHHTQIRGDGLLGDIFRGGLSFLRGLFTKSGAKAVASHFVRSAVPVAKEAAKSAAMSFATDQLASAAMNTFRAVQSRPETVSARDAATAAMRGELPGLRSSAIASAKSNVVMPLARSASSAVREIVSNIGSTLGSDAAYNLDPGGLSVSEQLARMRQGLPPQPIEAELQAGSGLARSAGRRAKAKPKRGGALFLLGERK